MPSVTKAFIYARKSTDTEDRQIFSIEHQLREQRALAARLGIEVVAELTEHRTAKHPGRPIFNEMLTRMKRGEASCILAWHPDRLARNAVDGGQIIHLVDTGVIADLKFAEYWFEPTPQGMLMLSIAFGMSKYYVDSLSQGIKRNYRQRIQEGFWPRRPPLGYLFDRNTRTIILDPTRAPLVRLVFDLYAGGDYTLDRLTQVVNARGLRGSSTRKHPPLPLSRSQYHMLLQNPFYVGVLRHLGELYPGKHEPVVTTRVFDACQIMLAQRGNKFQPDRPRRLYAKMFTCGECGATITNEFHKGNVYLRCTKKLRPCSQPYLREDDATRQAAAIARKLAIPTKIGAWMISEFQTNQRHDETAVADDMRRISTAIANDDAKQSRLTEAYVEGTLSASEFRDAKAKLVLARQASVEKLAFLEKHRTKRLEPAIRFVRGSMKARDIAENGDATAQRDFLQKAGSNLKVLNGEIVWEPRGAWKHVAATGFLAAIKPVASPWDAPSGEAFAVFPTWSTDRSAARTLLENIISFFHDNPSWE